MAGQAIRCLQIIVLTGIAMAILARDTLQMMKVPQGHFGAQAASCFTIMASQAIVIGHVFGVVMSLGHNLGLTVAGHTVASFDIGQPFGLRGLVCQGGGGHDQPQKSGQSQKGKEIDEGLRPFSSDWFHRDHSPFERLLLPDWGGVFSPGVFERARGRFKAPPLALKWI
jgi:hypothetical protein